MNRGRKPAGSRLVEGLPGSDFAKERLRKVLETLSGEATIEEACEALQISRTRFYDLRNSMLEEMVERLEPRPAGRPREMPKEEADVTELKRQVARLEVELEATRIRSELNTFLPLARPPKKKRR